GVGAECGDGGRGGGRGEGKDWKSCGAGGSDVADGIPDHDGVTGIAAGTRDRSPQQVRMGLLQPERVRPANGGEAICEAKRVKQPHREPLELVGADRKTAAAGGELVERCFEAGERSGAVGDVRGIVLNEVFDEAVSSVRACAARERSIIDRAPPPTKLRAVS